MPEDIQEIPMAGEFLYTHIYIRELVGLDQFNSIQSILSSRAKARIACCSRGIW